ncbi:MAG: PhoH family protein [Pseudomonadales bacterium]|uniref:PhoH family protein n=1 Tax=unclassified Ketobacter TaxID=2639109 RepID=UPI000C58D639|nr:MULTISPECIES: PhoH family protein [unclassified Ketobacter]MAQ26554.1 PhoH family protein [Pseudomonadales bacterium]MEC8811954.1 PhoH family protein [Pseudomonadota bacterium]TNC88165.1 MAG: PhoH family protein [Alcanivorax sp.]HAG95244.1 PhoH family protein [Gammaproteobacteria bacterium]MBI26287.1 PhoH family protein [Pseudomonadales bacterium]
MNEIVTTHQLKLEPADSSRLAKLCGQFDEHLRQIEDKLDVQIANRGNAFQLTGHPSQVNAASEVLHKLYKDTQSTRYLTPDDVHLMLRESLMNPEHNDPEQPAINAPAPDQEATELGIRTRKGMIKPRGENQKAYVRQILRNDINFGIGPAGTGKTYLAVACAVEALEAEQVRRILLVRPAVEAGEKLGFLPGDLAEKINPYLRPLYDALYEMLGFERVAKFIDRQIIEVAPLAYMRGRTLNNSFIILDESQNTTKEQMKMFLTRIGFGSKAVITGDYTQIDLPRGTKSGLVHAMDVLKEVNGIGFSHFQSKDVVRHTLVQRIVEAYDRHETDDMHHDGH